ncbi:MAG TPA: glycosyltransferase family 39 protein [Candidatus Sulfotelmatobacter sp.]|nr:glycosyltransferase family 39 protein [Candidatus Sulfotelmatobacter sp.]
MNQLAKTEDTGTTPQTAQSPWKGWASVLAASSAIFLGCIVSPPSLMDDVDAVQAVIARNMLHSGDWVTARLNGIIYLEKPPLIYWLIAMSYKIFGEHDWAARIPVALSCVALALLTAAMGTWAFGRKAGTYAGIVVATCVGLFLFTRIQIPDVMLTFTIALAMWALLRVLDQQEKRPSLWANVLAASLGVGLLLKSLVGVVFPVAAGLVYLLVTRQCFRRETWQRLHPFRGALIAFLIAAPWHILATLRNPPYFAWTLHSGPGQYHGFFWFFFINEQLLRFLNLRYPRDYNTVPRPLFWAFHLLWLFPWSVYFPALFKLRYKPIDRAGRMSLLALCWAGFILVFFTFSTTQEYYSMPVYPAFALLLGAAIAQGGSLVRWGTRVLGVIAALAALATFSICWMVRHVPTPGDISNALALHPRYYTLSLGHMLDLTLDSFAYLRTPLVVAGIAFLLGAFGCFLWRGKRAVLAVTLMMVLFFHAARLALVVFDPFLSSRPLAEAIQAAPPGNLIVTGHFYPFSSVFFYLDREALLLNGIRHNLEYGAAAPNAPKVFLTDDQLPALWDQSQRWYLVTKADALPKLTQELGADHLTVLIASGGKTVLTNQPLPAK